MKYLNIFHYLDYRNFLRDYYEKRKQADSVFSYRFFARRAGYNSSGLYSNVVKGLTNLSDAYTEKFIQGLGIEGNEARYFRFMVQYTHAQSEEVREDILSQMMPLMPRKISRMRNEQKKFYGEWYHAAVHQALGLVDVNEDVEPLCEFIRPKVSESQARTSLDLLQKLHLVVKNEQGFWKPAEEFFIGGAEVGVDPIQHHQNQMMDLAKNAQTEFEKTERQMITATLTTTEAGKERIQRRIQHFQKELVDILNSEDGADRVFQINVQFFPLSLVNSEK